MRPWTLVSLKKSIMKKIELKTNGPKKYALVNLKCGSESYLKANAKISLYVHAI
jgi:hypothetical protein